MAMSRKIISLLLTFGLIFPVLKGTTVSASTPVRESSENRLTLIVTLESPSLLDYVISSNGKYRKVSELLVSPDGKRYRDIILSSQSKAKRLMEEKIPDSDFSDSRSYVALTNGFTLTAPFSCIPDLRSVPGVKSVSVSDSVKTTLSKNDSSLDDRSDEPELPDDNEKNNDPSTDDNSDTKYSDYSHAFKASINADDAYDAGYTGKNILIAVIDSEFDPTHSAFSTRPEQTLYDKDYVRSIHNISPLQLANDVSIDDVFYNGKIIYAYDYGENDTDCKDEDSYHGTHVSGIAAGNSGGKGLYNYKGVAYDSQLALFKIADPNGTLDDDATLAALDDAVKLGPDVINCSYGARRYLCYDYEGKQLYEKLAASGTAVVAAVGNDGYNGYQMGFKDIPADYITYGTTSIPSSLDSAFSVAASEPMYKYEQRIYFLLNGDKTMELRSVPISVDNWDELLSKNVSDKPDEGDDDPDDGEEKPDKGYVTSESFEYVFLDSDGRKSDFDDIDVTDKIVILYRGDVPLKEVMTNAIKNGSSGVAVIDNGAPIPSSESPTADFNIYLIDKSQREYFDYYPNGRLDLRTDTQLIEQPVADGGNAAPFSSFGVRSDLTLKPDIAAPGDNVLSAGYNEKYSILSGTSMATPCVTGAYSIVKQYVKEKELAASLSPRAEEELVYKLLMSTSKPSPFPQEKNSDSDSELYYSPRAQGSGVIDLKNAVSSEAYLSVNGEHPKVSLKDSATGSFRFSFTVTNISDKQLTYSLDLAVQTDSYSMKKNPKTGKEEPVNSMIPKSIKDKTDIIFIVNGQPANHVTVEAGGETKVEVRIALDSGFIDENRKIFKYGFYEEGFVLLRGGDITELSLPFTGFCGDWSEAPIFSSSAYDELKTFPELGGHLTAASLIERNSINFINLGLNTLGYDKLPGEISFGYNSVSSYRYDDDTHPTSVLLPNVYLLRDTLDFTITITDMGGNMIYQKNFGSVPTRIHGETNQVNQFEETQFEPLLHEYEEVCRSLFEGKYIFTMSAATVGTDGNPGRKEERSFTVRVDNTPPQILSAVLDKQSDGTVLLRVEIYDNACIQGLELFAVEFDNDGNIFNKFNMLEDYKTYLMADDVMEYGYDSEKGIYQFTYDITRYREFVEKMKSDGHQVYSDENITIEFIPEHDYITMNQNVIALRALDYAYNSSPIKLLNVNNYCSCSLKFFYEDGSPASDFTITFDGEEKTTNEKGELNLINLFPSEKTIILQNKQYEFSNGSTIIKLPLSEKNYIIEKTFVLRKRRLSVPIDEPTPRNDTKANDHSDNTVTITPDAKVKNYPTGDDRPIRIFMILFSFSAIILTVKTGRKRKRRCAAQIINNKD